MAKSKNTHTSHAEGSSSQGEHIFNALGDFASEMADTIESYIDSDALPDKRTAAELELKQLRLKAEELKKARDHESFRSAPEGDDENARVYSDFCNETREAVKNILSAEKSVTKQGVQSMMLLKPNVENKTIDDTARKSARGELAVNRQGKFDEWFNATKALMEPLFLRIGKTAASVRQTYK